MSELLNPIFRRMASILKKNHPDESEVKEFFQQYVNDDRVVELVLFIDDKGILEATYSMEDVMTYYHQWNILNKI